MNIRELKNRSFYIITRVCIDRDNCQSSACSYFYNREKRIAINDYQEIGRFAINKRTQPDTQRKKSRSLLINNETQCNLYAREFIEKGYIRTLDCSHYYKIREATKFESKILKKWVPLWIKTDLMNIYNSDFSLNTIVKFAKENYQTAF